jgi:hypothetical protein
MLTDWDQEDGGPADEAIDDTFEAAIDEGAKVRTTNLCYVVLMVAGSTGWRIRQSLASNLLVINVGCTNLNAVRAMSETGAQFRGP